MYEYTGVNFIAQGDLPIDQYYSFLRDAFICKLNKTEEGQQYLDRCWRMEQTKPDRKALREKFHRGMAGGSE